MEPGPAKVQRSRKAPELATTNPNAVEHILDSENELRVVLAGPSVTYLCAPKGLYAAFAKNGLTLEKFLDLSKNGLWLEHRDIFKNPPQDLKKIIEETGRSLNWGGLKVVSPEQNEFPTSAIKPFLCTYLAYMSGHLGKDLSPLVAAAVAFANPNDVKQCLQTHTGIIDMENTLAKAIKKFYIARDDASRKTRDELLTSLVGTGDLTQEGLDAMIQREKDMDRVYSLVKSGASPSEVVASEGKDPTQYFIGTSREDEFKGLYDLATLTEARERGAGSARLDPTAGGGGHGSLARKAPLPGLMRLLNAVMDATKTDIKSEIFELLVTYLSIGAMLAGTPRYMENDVYLLADKIYKAVSDYFTNDVLVGHPNVGPYNDMVSDLLTNFHVTRPGRIVTMAGYVFIDNDAAIGAPDNIEVIQFFIKLANAKTDCCFGEKAVYFNGLRPRNQWRKLANDMGHWLINRDYFPDHDAQQIVNVALFFLALNSRHPAAMDTIINGNTTPALESFYTYIGQDFSKRMISLPSKLEAVPVESSSEVVDLSIDDPPVEHPLVNGKGESTKRQIDSEKDGSAAAKKSKKAAAPAPAARAARVPDKKMVSSELAQFKTTMLTEFQKYRVEQKGEEETGSVFYKDLSDLIYNKARSLKKLAGPFPDQSQEMLGMTNYTPSPELAAPLEKMTGAASYPRLLVTAFLFQMIAACTKRGMETPSWCGTTADFEKIIDGEHKLWRLMVDTAQA